MKIIAQINKNKIHLLFVHVNNKSNSDQIGQVVVMGGNEQNPIFFLVLPKVREIKRCKSCESTMNKKLFPS